MRSDVRAEERREKKRDGLFGGQGLLAQLRAGEAAAAAMMKEAAAAPVPGLDALPRKERGKGVVGAPSRGDQRAAERQAAKDERNRLLLEERAMRLQAESAEAALKKKKALAPVKRPAHSASAPGLGRAPVESAAEVKQRLQRKMEVLNFMSSYTKNPSNLNPEQAALLLAQLNSGKLFESGGGSAIHSAMATPQGSAPRDVEPKGEEAQEEEDEEEQEEDEDDEEEDAEGSVDGADSLENSLNTTRKPMHEEVEQGGSLQDRLRHLNEECTRVFEADMDDLEDLDL